jgi:hypothetical protein
MPPASSLADLQCAHPVRQRFSLLRGKSTQIGGPACSAHRQPGVVPASSSSFQRWWFGSIDRTLRARIAAGTQSCFVEGVKRIDDHRTLAFRVWLAPNGTSSRCGMVSRKTGNSRYCSDAPSHPCAAPAERISISWTSFTSNFDLHSPAFRDWL